jgi:hypothetical protein
MPCSTAKRYGSRGAISNSPCGASGVRRMDMNGRYHPRPRWPDTLCARTATVPMPCPCIWVDSQWENAVGDGTGEWRGQPAQPEAQVHEEYHAATRSNLEGRDQCLFTISDAGNAVRSWRSSSAPMKARESVARTAAASPWRSSSPPHTS